MPRARPNPLRQRRLGQSDNVAQLVADTATQNGVNPNLAVEVAVAESRLNQSAVSPKGAIGVMQLMPATARAYGVDPYDLVQNVRGGVMLLRDLFGRFTDPTLVLAAYNWGEANVRAAIQKWGPSWLQHAPGETQNYVARILGNLATQYQTTVTPASVATGAVQAAVKAADLLAPEGKGKILVLTGLGVAVYLIADLLTD